MRHFASSILLLRFNNGSAIKRISFGLARQFARLCACIEAMLFGFRKMAEQMGPLSKVQFDQREI